MAQALNVRRDVWALTREDPWHPTIQWYARGVRALQGITDEADPRSWIHLANIHGTVTPRMQWPSGIGKHTWNACQHGSWFFLPWHRIYLHHCEKILRAAIVDLGGPGDWALPFWHYDPDDAETLTLPLAFRDRRFDDGPNPLFVARRNPSVNAGDPIPEEDVETEDWSDRFTSRSFTVPTFGGPRTGWTHAGPAFGQLEIEPHGMVHVDVGGSSGLMSAFETAAQDPIFWLHHANIDRLWEIWAGQPGHKNPSASRWRDAEFTFGRGQWETHLKVSDVIDPAADPLRYRYSDRAGRARPAVVMAREREPEDTELDDAVSDDADEVAPELVGASKLETTLGDVTTLSVSVGEPKRPQRGVRVRGGRGRRIYLTLENVTATGIGAGKYVVFVNLPQDADPSQHRDRRAGRISTFGVAEESLSDEEHSGSGATYSFDITKIVELLKTEGEWDPDDVRVTILPRRTRGIEGDAAEVRIGRVGVYTE